MLLARLLQEGTPDFRVIEFATKNFQCTRKVARKYLEAARGIVRSCLEKTFHQLLCESVAYWQTAISDTNASRSDRNNARAHLDRLLGLEAPKHIFLHDQAADMGEAKADEKRRTEEILEATDPEELRAVLALRKRVKERVIDITPEDEE
jgi:hypothetical protein